MLEIGRHLRSQSGHLFWWTVKKGIFSIFLMAIGLAMLFTSCRNSGENSLVQCLANTMDQSLSVTLLLFITIGALGILLFDFLFKIIYRHNSIRTVHYKELVMKLTVLINSLFVVLSFQYQNRHQMLFSLIVIGIQSVSHAMYDIYLNRDEFLEEVLLVDASTPMVLMISIVGLYFFNMFIFINFNNFFPVAHLMNFTIAVSLKLILLAFISTMLEFVLMNCYNNKLNFYLKLFSPIILEIICIAPKIMISLYLISENMKLETFRRYFGITFFSFRLIAAVAIVIIRVYYLFRAIYDLIMAEKTFKWANEKQLIEYDRPCSICWEKMESGRILYCSHIFHDACIKQWLFVDKTCPVCRQNCFRITQQPSNQNSPIFQINLTNWIPSLPVIEIYRNDIPTDNGQTLNDGATNAEMTTQIIQMFPDLSYELVFREVSRAGFRTTLDQIMENPEPFNSPEPETVINEESIQAIESSKNFSSGFSISKEEYNELLNLDQNEFKCAFNGCKEDIRQMTLNEKYELMKEYSRKQYLLKNCINAENQEGA